MTNYESLYINHPASTGDKKTDFCHSTGSKDSNTFCLHEYLGKNVET